MRILLVLVICAAISAGGWISKGPAAVLVAFIAGTGTCLVSVGLFVRAVLSEPEAEH
jgi:hypothetical protein